MKSKEEVEWEICKDGGFVYKRARLTNLNSVPPPPQSPTSSARRHLSSTRRSRKKKMLISLKHKYELELQQWQQLSDSISNLSSTAAASNTEDTAAPNSNEIEHSAFNLPAVDDLLSEVEGQEEILKKLEGLCDTLDSICNADEEKFVNELIDSGIGGSPKHLVRSLTYSFQD